MKSTFDFLVLMFAYMQNKDIAIINKDDFTIASECVAKTLVDLPHGIAFIEHRYDDTDLRSLPINRLRGVILCHLSWDPRRTGLKP